MRTLIGGIGYPDLRDHSAGLEVIARLAQDGGIPGVVIEDTSYNPIAVVQWLQGEPAEDQFDQVIFVSAVERGRPAGTVTAYRWDGVLPPEELVQQAVTEAVTGVIALDNTVVIAGHFKALPPLVTVVEIEPLDHAFGSDLSAPAALGVDQACEMIRTVAVSRSAAEALPRASVAGRPLVRVDW